MALDLNCSGRKAEAEEKGLGCHLLLNRPLQPDLPFDNENIHCAHFEVERWHWKCVVHVVTYRYKR